MGNSGVCGRHPADLQLLVGEIPVSLPHPVQNHQVASLQSFLAHLLQEHAPEQRCSGWQAGRRVFLGRTPARLRRHRALSSVALRAVGSRGPVPEGGSQGRAAAAQEGARTAHCGHTHALEQLRGRVRQEEEPAVEERRVRGPAAPDGVSRIPVPAGRHHSYEQFDVAAAGACRRRGRPRRQAGGWAQPGAAAAVEGQQHQQGAGEDQHPAEPAGRTVPPGEGHQQGRAGSEGTTRSSIRVINRAAEQEEEFMCEVSLACLARGLCSSEQKRTKNMKEVPKEDSEHRSALSWQGRGLVH